MTEPRTKGENEVIKLSIIVIAYNMQRVIPRTIRSLLSPYQTNMSNTDYEILIIENGSSNRLDQVAIESLGPNVRYHFLENAAKSPAKAINFGVQMARGEIVAIMVDGAHMATPALLQYGLIPFLSEPNPIVTAPRFFLGLEAQMDSIGKGYDEDAEDALLRQINWPDGDAYQLFEISTPYRYDFPGGPPKLFWFQRQFESNCLLMRRLTYLNVGGCDERFDYPGGGCLLPDLYRQCCEMDDASIVQIIGEATFHQIHGGITTNAPREKRVQLWREYTEQYKLIRGREFEICKKPQQFFGHMPNSAAAKLMLTG